VTEPGKDAGPPKVTNLLWVLRLLMAVHVLIALAQAVFAGTFLDGDSSALRMHQLTGTSVIVAISVLQVVVAVLCWRRHQHSAWLALGSAGLFVAEVAQIGLGFTDQLALHVPLGASILAAAVTLLFASLKHYGPPATRRGHPKQA
jgi:Na+/proline symporter